MTNVPDWKKGVYQELKDLVTDHSVIGIVNIDGIPGPQMLNMRRNLWGDVKIKIAKKKIIQMVLAESEDKFPGISKMADSLEGQVGVVATDMNPFKLYQIMKKTITPSPAKGGEKAPDDIIVKAGDTPFKPGPIVGDFGKAGIPAAIEKGKVVIKKTLTVVKEGDVIPLEVAQMLTKLEIYPMKVGMNLRTAYDEGTLYKPKDLDIDTDVFRSDIQSAAQRAFNLAMFAAILTPMTVKPLIQKAQQQAVSLAVEAAIPTKDTMDILLTKAYTQMLSLASQLPDGLDEDLQARIGAGAAAAPVADSSDGGEAAPEETPPEEEEEEEVSEEEAMSGLGALFG